MTDHTFEVHDVFRIALRKGPIIVGRLTGGHIKLGDELISRGPVPVALRVIGVEMHTAKGLQGLMVDEDVGPAMDPGSVFDVHPHDIPRR